MLRLHKFVPKTILQSPEFNRPIFFHNDEEEYSVVLTLGKRLANNLLAQYQFTFFLRWVQFL